MDAQQPEQPAISPELHVRALSAELATANAQLAASITLIQKLTGQIAVKEAIIETKDKMIGVMHGRVLEQEKQIVEIEAAIVKANEVLAAAGLPLIGGLGVPIHAADKPAAKPALKAVN